MAQVGYVRDDETCCEVLVIGDEAAGTWWEIQRAFEFDEQDVDLGMDTYCLVRDGAATHYGGITIWNVTGDRLTLTLTDDAAAALGVAHHIEFTVGAEGQTLLRDHLPQLLS